MWLLQSFSSLTSKATSWWIKNLFLCMTYFPLMWATRRSVADERLAISGICTIKLSIIKLLKISMFSWQRHRIQTTSVDLICNFSNWIQGERLKVVNTKLGELDFNWSGGWEWEMIMGILGIWSWWMKVFLEPPVFTSHGFASICLVDLIMSQMIRCKRCLWCQRRNLCCSGVIAQCN